MLGKVEKLIEHHPLKFEKVPDSVHIITLDGTADDAELIAKAIELQHRIKQELHRLSICKENHRLQTQENVTLKEYVSVLLKSTNRLGVDRHGAPIPSLRRS
jgi:hypothetical protein